MNHISHRDHINAFMGKRTTVQMEVDEEKAERIATLLAAEFQQDRHQLSQGETKPEELREGMTS